LQFFANVYTTLGFDLPPLLLEDPVAPEPPPAAPTRTPTSIGAAAVGIKMPASYKRQRPTDIQQPQVPATNPELASQLEQRIETRKNNAQPLIDAWRLTPKAAKAAGLEQVVRTLTLGFEGPTGQQLLAPLPKDVAQETLGIMATLYRLSQRLPVEDVQDYIRCSNRLCNDLRQGGEILQQFAAANGLPYTETVQLPDLRRINRIANNWNAFRQLILAKWPPAEAPAVVKNLEPLVASIVNGAE